MISYSIFVVDDDPSSNRMICMALEEQYQIRSFGNAEDALAAMESDQPDLILLDIGLPGMSGIEALEHIKKDHPEVVVIMITAVHEIETVVTAIKLGAYEYVIKPIQIDVIRSDVKNALDTISLRKEIHQLQERYINEHIPSFIGESSAIREVMHVVMKAAKSTDTSVLIHGETGTGKELIARSIHYRSPNFKRPLIRVNCAAIPRELIESELFGYEKGAFTGADQGGKPGLVEKAEGGTLFLDEVGDLSMEAQAKLLRFLEEGEYYRVGGTEKRTVQTRVISATNRDLQRMSKDGSFRRDLYYRLAVVEIRMPSLNQRPDDIVPLARQFMMIFSDKFNKSLTGITPGAEQALKSFNWVGNVRELKNRVERAVLLAIGKELTLNDLDFASGTGPELEEEEEGLWLPPLSMAGVNYVSLLDSVERYYFETALELAKGNVSLAARLLNLSRDKFRYRKVKVLN